MRRPGRQKGAYHALCVWFTPLPQFLSLCPYVPTHLLGCCVATVSQLCRQVFALIPLSSQVSVFCVLLPFFSPFLVFEGWSLQCKGLFVHQPSLGCACVCVCVVHVHMCLSCTCLCVQSLTVRCFPLHYILLIDYMYLLV